MKLPALWIVAAFAAGIGAASRGPVQLATRVPLDLAASPKIWIAATTVAILIGAILQWSKRTTAGLVCALLAWSLLGCTAISLERTAVPANQISRLIAEGRIDAASPLRWHGTLREDPEALPWGHRYTIDIDSVQTATEILSISGGLRANLYRDSRSSDDAASYLRAGDRVEALMRAQPSRNFLDPGAFDLKGYLAGQNIDVTGTLRSAELLQITGHPRPNFLEYLARTRGNLLSRLNVLFEFQHQRAAVLRAMLLGDRGFVDSITVTAFQETAAYHVLVVAGLHVGALVVFLFWLCRKLRFSISVTTLVTLSALAAYVGVVQDRPPILRAALMAAFYLCARPLFRRVELLNTVAFAALVLLLWKPSSLVDSSFQLSFLAAGVIAGLALPWMRRTSEPYREGLAHLGDVTRDGAHPPKIAQFRIETRAASQWLSARLPKWLAPRSGSIITAPLRAGLRLWEIVLLSAVIQWGMMPLLARDFHRVSIAGPISNIPAVTLTGLIVPLGFLALLMTFIWMRAAVALAKALGFFTGILLATVTWFSTIPHLSYRIPGPPGWLTIAFFAAFILLAMAAHKAAAERKNRLSRRRLPAPIAIVEWASALALLGLTVLVAWYPFRPDLARGKLEVNVLDVGQGDSIFTAFPDGRTMLIDGGGLAGSERIGGYRSGTDVGEDVVSPYLWSRGLKRIDVIVLSHAHHDHLDGLHTVLANFEVHELWIGRDEETPAFQDLLSEGRAKGVKIVHWTQGQTFDWDGVQGEVLWPPDAGPKKEASNDDSLVLRLTDGSKRFLLPGDIEQGVENKLVAENAPLASDFLKVPHHGSKTSSTLAFLGAVEPQIAAVSAGEGNPFGHPAPNIVQRYATEGIRLLRTDRDGAITAITDGENLSVRSLTEGKREENQIFTTASAIATPRIR